MATKPTYKNKEGKSVSETEWKRLLNDEEYRQIECDLIPGRYRTVVKTIWDGGAQARSGKTFAESNPFLSTVISDNSLFNGYAERYKTKNKAIKGHYKIVGCLYTGDDPFLTLR